MFDIAVTRITDEINGEEFAFQFRFIHGLP